MTSTTPFSDRYGTAAAAFAAVGVTPPHASAMAEADQAVADKLTELSQAVAGSTVDDVTDAARRWARGDLKVDTLAKKITAPTVRSANAHTVRVRNSRDGHDTYAVNRLEVQRYQAARKAAQAALVADLDRPEWAATALVDQCREGVKFAMDDMATAAAETLEALPLEGKDWLLNNVNARPQNIAKQLINGQVTPSAHIDRYREAAAAWSALMAVDGLNGGGWLELFNTMAAGRPVVDDGTAAAGRRLKHFPSDRYGNTFGSPAAIWMDWETNVAMSFFPGGMAGAVLNGRGTFAPLVDPLGTDAEEYHRRWAAGESVKSWAVSKNERLSGKLRDNLQIYGAGTTLPALDSPVHVVAGYSSPAEALAAYLADHNRS